MNPADHQQVIDAHYVITDTRELMEHFEVTGMNAAMENACLALHEFYTRRVRQQRNYTQAMLDNTGHNRAMS